MTEEIIAGRNAVSEALKGNRSINKILITKGEKQGSIKEIIAKARDKGLIVQETEAAKLSQIIGNNNHQGIVAFVAPVEYVTTEEILKIAADKQEDPFILLLDEIEDPHNLGAILRTADAAGVHGVLIPKRRASPLTATVAKTSAGAIEYVPVARIGNIVQEINRLKKMGIWVVGADMAGESNYYDADLRGPVAVVIGNEGKGIGRLVKENCDFLVNIPMQGKIGSLNASVASSLLMYEIVRQRNGQG